MSNIIRLSENFHLDELTITQVRHEDNTPSPKQIANLQRVCVEGLQPLRDHFGRPVIVSSGFRSLKVNTIIGGSKTSRHMDGLAADFIIPGISLKYIVEYVMASKIEYDQIIYEYGRWIHLGFAPEGHTPRKEALYVTKATGWLVYKPELVAA